MKKRYQKRLGRVVSNQDESILDEPLPEIAGLDDILELPKPFKEVALVQAICEAHRRSSVKPHAKSANREHSPLAHWIDSTTKAQQQDNQN